MINESMFEMRRDTKSNYYADFTGRSNLVDDKFINAGTL